MIAATDRSKRSDDLESMTDKIIAAGYGKEFKALLHDQMSLKKAIQALKLNHPDLVI